MYLPTIINVINDGPISCLSLLEDPLCIFNVKSEQVSMYCLFLVIGDYIRLHISGKNNKYIYSK